jgi:nucleobase:cation symporter-1, NCS1 family
MDQHQEDAAKVSAESQTEAVNTPPSTLAVEWRGIERVPEEERYGTPRQLSSFWFALQLFPVAFFLGALGNASFIGLPFWLGSLSIIVGTVAGSVLVGALSVMGPLTGLDQLTLARVPFGRSVRLPAVLAYAVSFVFLVEGAIFGAQALEVMFGMPFYVGLALTFLAEGVISIVGYALLHRYTRLTAAVAGLGFLTIAIVVISRVGDVHIAQTSHGAGMFVSFLLFASIALSFTIAWCPYPAGFCRYLPSNSSQSSVFWNVFNGTTLGCVLVMILGLAAGSLVDSKASAMQGLFDLVHGGPIGYFVMITLLVGVIANIAACDYAAGLQILATGLKIWRPVVTGITMVLGFGVAAWLVGADHLQRAKDLILLVTYWIGPFVAIVLIDWRRLSAKQHIELATKEVRELPSGVPALIALVGGFIICLPFSSTALGDSLAESGGVVGVLFGSVARATGTDLAYPVGLLVGGLLYLALQPHKEPSPVTPS